MSESTEPSFQEQAALWGQSYEVLVKRGVLAYLFEKKLINPNRESLQPWKDAKLLEVSRLLSLNLGLIDESMREIVNSAVAHMALTAYGGGFTAIREYFKSIRATLKNPDALKVRALWCPLTLPGQSSNHEESGKQFLDEFQLLGTVDPDWFGKGKSGNADFILWLSGDTKEDYLLVQEYAFSMPAEIGDFRTQEAHLEELLRHRRIIDSRSVFAKVSAEVDGESFELSRDITTHLSALTTDNKPLYKLFQACSYTESTVALLRARGGMSKPCNARALAITPNGLESLGARFTVENVNDPRCKLMTELGWSYRNTKKIADGDEVELTSKVEGVFKGIISKLPTPLRKGVKYLRDMPTPGEDYLFEFNEILTDFANPRDKFTTQQCLDFVNESATLLSYFGEPTKDALARNMVVFSKEDAPISLRDLHAAAIVAGLRRSKVGAINVIGLEGNPGIGKTTAIRKHLAKEKTGFFFLYVSPRVIINRDVTDSLALEEDRNRTGIRNHTGILTITSNSELIAGSERWHAKQVGLGLDTHRHIEGAVVANGVTNLIKPKGSMLVLDSDQEQEIDAEHAGAKINKDHLSEHEDLVKDRNLVGVLKCMAITARKLLECNPNVNRLVLTAALQGFREKENKNTTIDALSRIFENDASKQSGRDERRAFARRMPHIVVMVDELAGDGAGAPFVHAIADWLRKEFIDCFDEEGESPFTVTLVVSDASLGNEIVLDRYLNAGDRTPDKVLISASSGKAPFRLAVTKVKIGRCGIRYPVLHVMTNSFPASKLHLNYKVKLSAVDIIESQKKYGVMESPREAIRRVTQVAILNGAVTEIISALKAGARQVIYYAQDKSFLREIKRSLQSVAVDGISNFIVELLDSSVPGWKRKQLIEEKNRDRVHVFLMTSSGARGVSFPLADWIIVSVPRFNIESALMEIAQLIYRGRGSYRDEQGVERDGDSVPRHLVMLIDDYIVSDSGMDKRQWLRQTIDLMTMLVMLRSTIFTRITGDSGLQHSLALVPVGSVGLDEIVSLMSQYVSQFVREANVFSHESTSSNELIATVTSAKKNVEDIFTNARLNGIAKRGTDGRTLVKESDMRNLIEIAANPIAPLLSYAQESSLPEHVYFSGPVIIESWAGFEKQELFRFEGHETEISIAITKLIGQLYEIDSQRDYPALIRNPAANLRRLLKREKHGSANEFRTIKNLKSPNTWISIPVGYYQFLYSDSSQSGSSFRLDDHDLWRDALGRTLNASSAVVPPLPHYDSFPWVACVGDVNPLRLDIVFNDKYFMASSELNLLNTLLSIDEMPQ